MSLVQVCGCKKDGDDSVLPFVSNDEAEFYGVYLGKPGSYKHHIDKPTIEEAMEEAHRLIAGGQAFELDDKTHD